VAAAACAGGGGGSGGRVARGHVFRCVAGAKEAKGE